MQDTINNALWLAAEQAASSVGPAPYPWLKYPMVVGHGLEAIPGAMAMHKAGVSAAKLVVRR